MCDSACHASSALLDIISGISLPTRYCWPHLNRCQGFVYAITQYKQKLVTPTHTKSVAPLLLLLSCSQNAKVSIKISDRNKMDPHTHEREVTISGTYSAIQLACAMISEKLSQNKPRMSNYSDGHDDDLDENGHHHMGYA